MNLRILAAMFLFRAELGVLLEFEAGSDFENTNFLFSLLLAVSIDMILREKCQKFTISIIWDVLDVSKSTTHQICLDLI